MEELHPEESNVIGVQIVNQAEVGDEDGDFSLLETRFRDQKPLSCFGCGIGWFSFVVGFVFPPLWYYATFLYFGNHYLKDPRERSGLAASAIAALICSVAVLISLIAVYC